MVVTSFAPLHENLASPVTLCLPRDSGASRQKMSFGAVALDGVGTLEDELRAFHRKPRGFAASPNEDDLLPAVLAAPVRRRRCRTVLRRCRSVRSPVRRRRVSYIHNPDADPYRITYIFSVSVLLLSFTSHARARRRVERGHPVPSASIVKHLISNKQLQ